MGELKEFIEDNIVTRTFNISGMPESVYKELDSYCKSFYGDSRWNMVYEFYRYRLEDYKYQLLYDTVKDLQVTVENLKLSSPMGVSDVSKPVVKTFGGDKK